MKEKIDLDEVGRFLKHADGEYAEYLGYSFSVHAAKNPGFVIKNINGIEARPYLLSMLRQNPEYLDLLVKKVRKYPEVPAAARKSTLRKLYREKEQ